MRKIFEFLNNMDVYVSFTMHGFYYKKWLNHLMMFISGSADFGISWLILILLTNLVGALHGLSIDLLVALLLATLIGQVTIKTFVKRKRPCQTFDNMEMLVPIPSDFSFPSSHTMTSFACATVLACYDPVLGVVGLIYATLVGISRIYLFVHYLSDVFAGALFGVIVGAFVFVL